MGSTHVKNVTIANFVTVIILHLIAKKIAVRMTSMKDSLPARGGESTPCGMMEAFHVNLEEYVLFKNGNAAIYRDLRDLSYERLWGKVERFAYLDDLLPERKEEHP